ncbi:DNA/RNA-binding protein Alba-like protein [Tanacetum coccineum]
MLLLKKKKTKKKLSHVNDYVANVINKDENEILTSTVDMKDENRGRPIQKAKIEILLGKTDKFDELMAAAEEERELANGEEQS